MAPQVVARVTKANNKGDFRQAGAAGRRAEGRALATSAHFIRVCELGPSTSFHALVVRSPLTDNARGPSLHSRDWEKACGSSAGP